jgi:hypothetical protein
MPALIRWLTQNARLTGRVGDKGVSAQGVDNICSRDKAERLKRPCYYF